MGKRRLKIENLRLRERGKVIEIAYKKNFVSNVIRKNTILI